MKSLVIQNLIAKVPIVQGGMGVGISLDNLASAVAREGGIGVISTAQIGFKDPEFLKNPLETNLKAVERCIKSAKEKAKGGIIAANIMVATRCYEKYVKAAVKAGVDLIISGAGLPISLPEYVKGSETKIAPIVSSEKAAKIICKMWDKKSHTAPDMVVIEGPLAGGHLGFHYDELMDISMDLYDEEIKKIMEAVKPYGEKYNKKIPVIVAGGIHDQKDVAHYLGLGADGVQVATRFVTTVECDADPKYKEAYLQAKKEDITIVKSPVGMPGRAIRNAFIKKVEAGEKAPIHCLGCLEKCDPKTIPYCITAALVNAALGKTDEGLVFCGARAYEENEIRTVHDVIEELTKGL